MPFELTQKLMNLRPEEVKGSVQFVIFALHFNRFSVAI